MNQDDTTTATSTTATPLDALATAISREVSSRSESLMRLQSLATRVQDVRARQAEMMKELSDIHSAWKAETNASLATA